MGTVGIDLQRQLPVASALALLADTEQQPRPTSDQPGVVVVQARECRKQFGGRGALLEALGALVQGHGQVNLATLAQGSRIGAERHLFVTEHAQVGEHEVGPALVQVAKEQQAQAVA